MGLEVLKGGACAVSRNPLGSAAMAIKEAVRKGCLVGSRVCIGNVQGQIIGYNLSGEGRYPGNRYPVLVSTAFGVTKASLAELSDAT